MASFGQSSLKRLDGVSHKLQDLAYRVVLEHHDCTILPLGGKRTQEEQLKLVATGKSKTMNSKHLEGLAIDLAPYPIDWNNTKRFYYFAGIVMAVAREMDLKIRWGGDWDRDDDLDDQSFNDLVHFELVE